jgi:hypothetical protein
LQKRILVVHSGREQENKQSAHRLSPGFIDNSGLVGRLVCRLFASDDNYLLVLLKAKIFSINMATIAMIFQPAG